MRWKLLRITSNIKIIKNELISLKNDLIFKLSKQYLFAFDIISHC